jgi:hypothetical protein
MKRAATLLLLPRVRLPSRRNRPTWFTKPRSLDAGSGQAGRRRAESLHVRRSSYAHAGGQKQTNPSTLPQSRKDPPDTSRLRSAISRSSSTARPLRLTGFCDVKMIGQDSFRVRTLQTVRRKQRRSGRWPRINRPGMGR